MSICIAPWWLLTRIDDVLDKTECDDALRRSDGPWLASVINAGVSSHLGRVMGIQTVETTNFHLRKVAGVDLSEVATKPRQVESGLRGLFGIGAQVIIEASILAAFRSLRVIPERDFVSLEEAIVELYSRVSNHNGIITKSDNQR